MPPLQLVHALTATALQGHRDEPNHHRAALLPQHVGIQSLLTLILTCTPEELRSELASGWDHPHLRIEFQVISGVTAPHAFAINDPDDVDSAVVPDRLPC